LKRPGRQRVRPTARAIAALLLAMLPGAATPLDWSALIVPGYQYSNTRSSGSVNTSSETNAVTQLYRLTIGQEFLPSLRLALVGSLNWDLGWTKSNGVQSETDRKRWNVNALLNFGTSPLSGQLYYQFNQALGETTVGGLSVADLTLNRELFGFNGTWSAAELPRVNLLLSQSHSYDSAYQLTDSVVRTLALTAEYAPVQPLSLRYSLNYAWGENRLIGATGDQLGQTILAAYGQSFGEGFALVGASYTGTLLLASANGAAGSRIPLQQFPRGGLSLVEPVTATPSFVTLQPNPAIIDGNTAVGAGLDIGFGASLQADTRYRDAGAAFTDNLTEVQLVYLWVDKRLPTEVAAAFTWTAYRSDDNQNWTQVPLDGPVVFARLDNRFEIPVALARAPYFKVITRPLAAGVTQDPLYSSILVTEIQLFRLVTSTGATTSITNYSGTASASARLLLLPSVNLTYQVAGVVFHTTNPASFNWSLTNTVSAYRQLGPIFSVRGQVEQSLGKARYQNGEVLQDNLRFTAGVDALFLPTLSSSLTYQGQLGFIASAVNQTYQSLSFTTLAEFYKGISFNVNLGYTIGTNGENSAPFRNSNAAASLSIVPNPVLTLTGTLGYSGFSRTNPAGLREVVDTGQVSGSVIVSPAPALYGAATVTWYPWIAGQTTVTNLNANFSPFQGGALLLTISYNQTFDPANGTRSLLWGPSLRWTIRPSTFLTANYAQARNSYSTYQTVSNFASLVLTIIL